MKQYFTILLIGLSLFSLATLYTACNNDEDDDGPNPALNLAAFPYESLSEYEFFEGNLADMSPNSELLPYELHTPLFSDYAGKSRFIFIPEGQSAQYTDLGVLDFPIGSIIVKTFYFENDLTDASKGRRIIETRLLVKYETEWQAFSYHWTDDQSAANFFKTGKIVPVEWTHTDGSQRSTNYLVPNKTECKSCHEIDGKMTLIGPKARNLNFTYNYADGPMNQLDKWQSLGKLTGLSENIPYNPKWDDPSTGSLDQRARAYLDVNCAHCHNTNSPADNSGLFLHYENVADSIALGICKTPVAAGAGSGGFQYDIVPGSADSSIVIYRMVTNEIEEMMPEIARSVQHQEGIDLIREWIDSLEGGCD